MKIDTRGIDTQLVVEIVRFAEFLASHTDMAPADIFQEISLRCEIARIVGTSLSQQVMQ